jgi:hypothetical protein
VGRIVMIIERIGECSDMKLMAEETGVESGIRVQDE